MMRTMRMTKMIEFTKGLACANKYQLANTSTDVDDISRNDSERSIYITSGINTARNHTGMRRCEPTNGQLL
jgi:hypothetical protein